MQVFGKIHLRGIARASSWHCSSHALARQYLAMGCGSLWSFFPTALRGVPAGYSLGSHVHASSEVSLIFQTAPRNCFLTLNCLDFAFKCLLTSVIAMMCVFNSFRCTLKHPRHMMENRRGFLAELLLPLCNSASEGVLSLMQCKSWSEFSLPCLNGKNKVGVE